MQLLVRVDSTDLDRLMVEKQLSTITVVFSRDTKWFDPKVTFCVQKVSFTSGGGVLQLALLAYIEIYTPLSPQQQTKATYKIFLLQLLTIIPFLGRIN